MHLGSWWKEAVSAGVLEDPVPAEPDRGMAVARATASPCHAPERTNFALMGGASNLGLRGILSGGRASGISGPPTGGCSLAAAGPPFKSSEP